MAFQDEFEAGLIRDSKLRWGYVKRNDDPEIRGRITAHIPGFLVETDWVEPLRPADGYNVPKVGETVGIWFILADPAAPVYIPGPPQQDEQTGKSLAPTAVTEQSPAQAPNVKALETETFEVFIKDTDTEKKLTLRAKTTSQQIEIDAGPDRSISITGGTTIIIQTDGIIDIKALRVQINNRIVSPVGPPHF